MKPITTSRTRKHALGLALLCALPQLAWAQSAREAELEARIAQLERTVAELVAAQQAPAAAPAQPAPQPAASTAQATPIVPGAPAGATFTVGGMVKFDAMVTDTTGGEIAEGSAGRMFYLPGAIPVGAASEATPDFNAHARFSRLWFGVDAVTEGGNKVKAYAEGDFFGGGGNALGNEVATNTHGFTLRHAYVQWNNWLAGQTWSNFQDVAALPDAVDFVGPSESVVFVRQAQLRYSNGPVAVSVENPHTVLTPYQGGAARLASGDASLPDVTARYTHRGSFGHVGVAGLVRQLRYETPSSRSSGAGYGLSVSGKYNLGANDDLRFALTGGRGIGRYVGFALGSDGVLDASGEIEPVGVLAGYAAWRHVFSPQWRSNLFYSHAQLDNDTALTGTALTRSAQSLHANLIYTPLPKLDVGAELIFGRRTLESGESGDLRRLHTHVRYSF